MIWHSPLEYPAMQPGSDASDRIRANVRQYLPPSGDGHDHLVWERAQGVWVWDASGRRLLDFTSGVLVTNTGHSHPDVVAAVQAQVATLMNCYDAPHPLKPATAARLVELAGPPFVKAALLTTGAEAIDAAVRVARAFTGKFEVVSFASGFHGRTLGAMSFAGLPSVRGGVGPVLPGTIILPYPTSFRCPVGACESDCSTACLTVGLDVLRANSVGSVAAVVVEPYLGTGGAYVPPAAFWPRLREAATALGALLIFDEVQSSFGRTGSMYAFQNLGVVPDLIVVAKGIASGFPMSAVIGQKGMLDALPPGSLGSTYGGNPVACAACLATVEVLVRDDLPAHAGEMGRVALDVMADWPTRIPGVGEVRGSGLSMGIEMVVPGTREPDGRRALATVMRADEGGLAVLPPAGRDANVVRLAPPLIIEEVDLRNGLSLLERALHRVATDMATP